MKEITRIHLAKTPFSVEVDAKKALEQYLRDIEKVMKAEPEAMREIEARMVELLAERGVKADGVVVEADVAALREQMGEPTVFSDSGEEVQAEELVGQLNEKPDKRLMRDPDNAVLEGVCAGVAAYLKIDVFWVRLLMVVLLFVTFGVALIVYIVMAIAMPPAKTAAEKLQMRGETITLDSLRLASEEVGRGDRRNRIGMKFVRVFLGSVFALVGFGLTIGLIVGGAAGISIVSLLDGFSAQNWAWGMWASLAIGGLAAIGLAILLAQSSFTWKIKKASGAAMIAMLAVLAFSISSVAVFSMQTAEHLNRDERRLTKVVPIELPANLDGVKYVNYMGHLVLDNDNRSSKIRAELRYFSPNDAEPPKVTVERDGDKLNVFVEEPQDCAQSIFLGWYGCFGRTAQVNFYGPVDYWQGRSLIENQEDEPGSLDQD